MFHTRRGFLRSLSAIALVLPLEDILALAIPPPLQAPGTMAPQQNPLYKVGLIFSMILTALPGFWAIIE
ncbi:MAG: hypothetical protein WAK33_08795 [Silvibacterium sp.]